MFNDERLVHLEPRPDEYYEGLAHEADRNLKLLESKSPIRNADLESTLRRNGVTRRDFIKWTAFMAATMGLPPYFDTRIARAAALSNRTVVIWQELQSCTGNTEAFIKSVNPDVETVLLDMISLEYSEVLMAPSGEAAEAQLAEAIERYHGEYLAVFEGSLPLQDEYLSIGHRHGREIVLDIARNAKVVLNAGTCAAYGGIPAARPNPTTAVGIDEFLRKEKLRVPIVNLPACPVNPINVVGTILEYLMFGRSPQLDAFRRPVWAYGIRIHDKCERRGNFDAGEFVEGWTDIEGLKKAYCLYKVGCKGPFTYNNCGQVRYNSGTSWPIQVGRGCIGCSEPDFWDALTPFEDVLKSKKYSTPLGNDATASTIGKVVLGATALGIAAHAVATALKYVAFERKESEHG